MGQQQRSIHSERPDGSIEKRLRQRPWFSTQMMNDIVRCTAILIEIARFLPRRDEIGLLLGEQVGVDRDVFVGVQLIGSLIDGAYGQDGRFSGVCWETSELGKGFV